MKRFFYTTAAVVAFAFSGMANTIELEVEADATEVLDCYQVATDVINSIKADGTILSPREENLLFGIAYDICVNSGKCTNCLKPVIISPN